MKKALFLLLILTLTPWIEAVSLARDQDPAAAQTKPAGLTNKEVVDMVKAGLTSEIIVAKIKSTPAKFDTSPEALSQLRISGVPDPVILAMVQGSQENGSGASVAPAVSGTLTEVKVPDGIEIEIQLKNTLSGQEAKLGDIVDFAVLRPVQINGVIVFDKDASARARVTTAKRAGHWGHAGKIEWAMQDVQAIDGSRVPARFTKREIGDSKGGTVAVAATATTILLGPAGLLWGLKKGKPAIIPAGNRYSVFVHGDTTVKVKTSANEARTP